MAVVPVSPHQIDGGSSCMPESPLVGQGTVGDSRVCVLVEGGEGSAIVVNQQVTWEREHELKHRAAGGLWKHQSDNPGPWGGPVSGSRPRIGSTDWTQNI